LRNSIVPCGPAHCSPPYRTSRCVYQPPGPAHCSPPYRTSRCVYRPPPVSAVSARCRPPEPPPPFSYRVSRAAPCPLHASLAHEPDRTPLFSLCSFVQKPPPVAIAPLCRWPPPLPFHPGQATKTERATTSLLASNTSSLNTHHAAAISIFPIHS
jgi:hypothetical protein